MGFADQDHLLEAANQQGFLPWLIAEDRRTIKRLLHRQGQVRNFATQMRRADGSCFWAQVTARCICNEHGRIAFYQGFLEDVTESRELEASL